MAPLRLRHPNGITTIDLDWEIATVNDLQQQIRGATDIFPSQQDLKAGYPPHSLELVPELPLSSLGLKPGDQVIVAVKPGSATIPATSSLPAPAATSARNPIAKSTPIVSALSIQSTKADHVATEGGVLVHRIVPDDNSCLFSSVALVFEQSITKASLVRQTVADTIRANAETYNAAVLGMDREAYIHTILKPNTWGGAIELSALAAHYGTEIASIDVETGRVDKFEPPQGAQQRCILVYSGIHYDAATLAPMADAPAEWHQTLFPVIAQDESDPIISAAKKLAAILRSKRAFTNTATFDLKCEVCKKGLKGEKEARAHAAETGHTSFGEF